MREIIKLSGRRKLVLNLFLGSLTTCVYLLIFSSIAVQAQSNLNNSSFMKLRTSLKSCISDMWTIKKADIGISPVEGDTRKTYASYEFVLYSTDKFNMIARKNIGPTRPQPPEDEKMAKLGAGRLTNYSAEVSFKVIYFFIPITKKVNFSILRSEIYGRPPKPGVPNPVPTSNVTPTSYEDSSIPNNLSNKKGLNTDKQLMSNVYLLGYSLDYIVFSSGFHEFLDESIIKKFNLKLAALDYRY